MHKVISVFLFIGLAVLLVIPVSAQDKKPAEPPKPAQSLSQELLWGWNSVGNKLITMAEDFPEDKYSFKAQKDERTFGETLLHIATTHFYTINAVKGTPDAFNGHPDTIRKKYPAKADIVKFLKQAVADGAQLIAEQGDSITTREFRSWGNRMVHIAAGLMGTIEHAGEHYGQLVVYYRLNGLIPPQSRPK